MYRDDKMASVDKYLPISVGAANEISFSLKAKMLYTLPSSTRIDAMMSSGSPMRPSAGMLRLSAVQSRKEIVRLQE